MQNGLSVDVEDWFQVGAFERAINRADWPALELRVEANCDAVLQIFADAGVKGTFFTLGWVAERFPDLVRRIVGAGHELASHGYDHKRVFTLTPSEFAADLKKTQAILEDLGGVPVRGYRAPSFSIDARTPWAHPILAEHGYAYSSSVAPVVHDHYGWPQSPRHAWQPLPDSDLVEWPVATAHVAGRTLAAGGGGFMRLLPYRFTRWAVARMNAEGHPAILYFHPWEIDPDQPRVMDASVKSKLRHYSGLSAMAGKLKRLLDDFDWTRADALLPDQRERAIAWRPPGAHPAAARTGWTGDIDCDHVSVDRLADPVEWDDFLTSREAATPFQSRAWCDAVARATGHDCHVLAARDRTGALTGLLPLHHVRSPLFGRALVGSGFAVDGGILADDSSTIAALARAAVVQAECRGAPSVELRGGPVPEAVGWRYEHGVYSSFARDLAADEEAELLAIPRKQRAEVRKALASDLTVTTGTDETERRDHYLVYAESVRNLGTPVFPKALFDAVLDAFGEDADILTVRHAGTPVASVLSLYWRGTVMPYWGGGTFAARGLRANERMYYALMNHARQKGCRRFDFGRSKVGTGPWSYKKNWGFEPQPLVYARWLAPGERARDTNPNSAKYRLQVDLWKRLPLWAANSIGPLIARGLG